MSKYLYGMHDPGNWEDLIRNAGLEAWCVHTEAVGCDPNDRSGKDFNRPAITPVVRLNNGYGSTGTIPLPDRYGDFAARCANYVSASSGAKHWIIGNEIGLLWESPDGQRITLANYVKCYLMVHDAIKRVQHDAVIMPQPPAPWNAEVPDAPDWVKQLTDMLNMIGRDKVGAIALHTYSHGHDPRLITAHEFMNPPYQVRNFQFRAYQDFMHAIPDQFRDLPVLITESNPDGWQDTNNGWIQEAYKEIDRWNQTNQQQIVCLAFYRWPNEDRQQFWIGSKPGVVEDFGQSFAGRYQPRPTSIPSAVLSLSMGRAGSKIRALSTINLRATPGNVNKDNWDVIGSVKSGDQVVYNGNTEDRDGLTWAQVATAAGAIGWIAYGPDYARLD